MRQVLLASGVGPSSPLLYQILFHRPTLAEQASPCTHKHRQTSLPQRKERWVGGGDTGAASNGEGTVQKKKKEEAACSLCKLADAASSLPD